MLGSLLYPSITSTTQTLRKLSQELWLRAPEALARFMQIPQNVPYCFNSYPCSSELCVRSACPDLLYGGFSSNESIPPQPMTMPQRKPHSSSPEPQRDPSKFLPQCKPQERWGPCWGGKCAAAWEARSSPLLHLLS